MILEIATCTKKKRLKLVPDLFVVVWDSLSSWCPLKIYNWKGVGVDNPDSATKIFPHDSLFPSLRK